MTGMEIWVDAYIATIQIHHSLQSESRPGPTTQERVGAGPLLGRVLRLNVHIHARCFVNREKVLTNRRPQTNSEQQQIQHISAMMYYPHLANRLAFGVLTFSLGIGWGRPGGRFPRDRRPVLPAPAARLIIFRKADT